MPTWTLGDITSQATAALGNRSDIALSITSFWANEAQRIVWDSMPVGALELFGDPARPACPGQHRKRDELGHHAGYADALPVV
jgi:hypothetical protein